MRWYTAIGMKKDDADGRFCVWVDGEEKVLTEMETILWAALTWSFCEEDKVHSQMHRLLVFSLGEKQAQEWADKEDFQFCLNRLVKRGLVVLTEGCTREEAVYSIISRSVMAPMAFSRTERMKHFMEALSMGKGLKFSLRAFKKPLLTEEEYQLLSYLQREGDVSYHLKCLKEKAKSRESHLEDSLQEQIQREFIIRQLALFMISLGKEAYIPSNFYKCEKRLVHILSDDEISAFFHEIDSYSPEIKAVSFLRLSTEYKVIFRLIYCCGLRISEARKLKWSDADLGAGILTIMHSKGHKDRLVYMSDDLTVLIKEYKTVLNDYYGCISEWVFPAREQGRCLCSVTINAAFRRAWNATPYADGCDKTPTVHCLRHSFVVKRMNLWMEEGASLREMLPFLSRYLGHQSTDDTFYYYHQISEAFQIIRDRDKTSGFVIPEVTGHEWKKSEKNTVFLKNTGFP